MSSRFKKNLKNLSINNKILLISSLAMMISVFMPWYVDIDKYNMGDMFIGITGPLYLIGWIILTLSSLSFLITILRLNEKTIAKLSNKESDIYLYSGWISLSLLIISNSIYLHNKFGVGLATKSIEIGLVVGLIASMITLITATLNKKNKVRIIENITVNNPLEEYANKKKVEYKDATFRNQQDLNVNRKSTVAEAISAYEKRIKENNNHIR